MISLYYISTLIFIWMNLFYLANITKIDSKFYRKDIRDFSTVQLLYYCSRVFYLFWIIIGLSLSTYYFSLILISLFIIKILLYFTSQKIYRIFNILTPILSIVSMIGCVIYYIMY